MDRFSAGNEVAFRVGFSGHSGHLRLEPLPPVERHNPLRSLPDFILVSTHSGRHPQFHPGLSIFVSSLGRGGGQKWRLSTSFSISLDRFLEELGATLVTLEAVHAYSIHVFCFS